MVRVECALSLSRIPLSDAFNVRFIAEMSDAESVVEESKPKDPSANPKPQSSELVDEELSFLKDILKLNSRHKANFTKVSRKYRGPPRNLNSVTGNNSRLTPS